MESYNRNQEAEWSFEENKLFENAIAECGEANSPGYFEKIASRVPGKTIYEVIKHYEALVEDVEMIESGRVPLPDYKTANQHWKKGLPWTKEEHEYHSLSDNFEFLVSKFLIGLERFGKGDWKSISKHCVVNRTPTQVASHAQKYFIRLDKSATASKR
ncbi:hypothetical protein RJ640_028199 [Escallonia rubra]|uniref:HTH myb-type domain-containing protein n=1 Tax=Escallonia rubra TaxID=112253 RepID=A0AA88U4Y3_9ASTE|nr:hypothetical protein RJ640_028199 [Escallonia rubra]